MVLAGENTPSRVELPLLKAVARARRWALELISLKPSLETAEMKDRSEIRGEMLAERDRFELSGDFLDGQ